jgi:hypothetical protein
MNGLLYKVEKNHRLFLSQDIEKGVKMSANSSPITSLPFVAARGILNTSDKILNPLCFIPVVAILPRALQIAINALGLAGTGVGAASTAVISLAPLPGAIKRTISLWNKDALTLSGELVEKIRKFSVDAVPFAGRATLRRLDAAVIATDRFARENAALQGERAAQLDTIKRLNEQIRALQSDHQQVSHLATARQDLEKRVAAHGKAQKELASEKSEQEREAAKLKAQTAQLHAQLELLQKQIQTLTSQLRDKEAASMAMDQELESLEHQISSSAQAVESARSIEEKHKELQQQIDTLTLIRLSLETASEETASQLESLAM